MASKFKKRGKDKRRRKGRADKGRPRVADKRLVKAYTLPPRYVAALAAAARVRTERGGAPVSASAILAGILAPHIEALEIEAGIAPAA